MRDVDHFAEAERLLVEADFWLDADEGWKADLTTNERLRRQASDVGKAEVHALLALTAAVVRSQETVS